MNSAPEFSFSSFNKDSFEKFSKSRVSINSAPEFSFSSFNKDSFEKYFLFETCSRKLCCPPVPSWC